MPSEEEQHRDFDRLDQAKAFAWAPVSGYQVGAALVTEGGRVFLGANLEFPGQPLASAVHAEQAAVSQALLAGCNDFAELLVSAPPCGVCRQFLREFNDGSLRIRVVDETGTRPAAILSELLPQAFGPECFLIKEPAEHKPSTPFARLPVSSEPWIEAAREALARSHAPYSGNPAAVVLTGAGQSTAGASLENAAFTPTLGPMQTTLSRWRLAGWEFDAIEQAWLIQTDTAQVDWEAASRALLASVTSAPLHSVGF